MLNEGIRKYLSSPVIGLFPFILYLILHVSMISEQYALMISLAFAIVLELSIHKYFKSRIFSITFYISGISLIMTFLFWLFVKDYLERTIIYPVICEICIVCLFIVVRVSRTYIATIYLRKKSPLQRVLFNEFYHIAAMVQYSLTMHIFSLFIFRQLKPYREHYDIYDIIAFIVTPIVLILGITIYQMMRIRSLTMKLRTEEWLPIVTDSGAVTGKISKKVSLNMKNKFLHPVVRVALVSEGKLFLQERAADDPLCPGKLDYPFEKYLLFNHEINIAARNSIRRMLGDAIADIPLKFVLKYVFENDITKRLIFLFVINIDNEELIKRTNKMYGKFWSVKQIDDAFADEIFSENFELEFEYMKNMVLAPMGTYTCETGA